MHRSLFAALPLLAQTALGAPQQKSARECVLQELTTVHVSTTLYVTSTVVPASGVAVSQTPDRNPAVSSSRKVIVQGTPIPKSTSQSWSKYTYTASIENQTSYSRVTEVLPSKNVTLGMPPSPSKATQGMRNVLYFTNWGIYGANYQPQMLPVDQVTHLLYAFGNIAADGTIKSSDGYSDLDKHFPGDSWDDKGHNAYGCVKQLYIHKKKNRKLKTLLSLGGWTASQAGKFSAFVGTEAGRQNFASSAVKILGDWGLDGIDIDWEYPNNPQETHNFVLLLKACREALDHYAADNGQDYHYLLTVAVAAGPQHYSHLDMKGMDPYLDAWHLMAYDYAGAWDTAAGHQANIYKNPSNPNSTKFNTEQAVEAYLQADISADKIVVGLPLYGRSFMNTDGLGKAFSGVGRGSIMPGIWLYRDLPRPGAKVQIDDDVGAGWSYDAAARELVTYDTPQSALLKAEYVKTKGLGGFVFWEAAGDKTGDESIVRTMAKAMGELESSENMLSYPKSRYDNIKNNMPQV